MHIPSVTMLSVQFCDLCYHTTGLILVRVYSPRCLKRMGGATSANRSHITFLPSMLSAGGGRQTLLSGPQTTGLHMAMTGKLSTSLAKRSMQ